MGRKPHGNAPAAGRGAPRARGGREQCVSERERTPGRIDVRYCPLTAGMQAGVYFGIMTVNALKIGKIMIIPMIILAFDLLSSFVAPSIYDFVSQYSSLYQRNQSLSLSLALAVLAISFLLFVFGRREKW